MEEASLSGSLLGASGGDQADFSLVDLVDHVLNKGVVLVGDATIAIADVDLIYLGLNILLTSVESAREAQHRSSSLPQEPAR